MLGALKVIGGRQFWRDLNGLVGEDFLWGSRSSFEVEVYSSVAYLEGKDEWLPSGIRFYVTAGSDDQSQGFPYCRSTPAIA